MENRFIVIEGLDGAGKSTQMNLLRNYFTANSKLYEDIHFPKLNQGVFGDMIAEFLRGEYGSLDEVHPKLVALLFACDRKEHVNLLEGWMEEGKYVLADRYVNSNIAYQCAKTKGEVGKEKLRKWIFDFEYDYQKLPRPAISIFLDVPFSFTKKSLSKERTGEDRDYLQGEKDIHEDSMQLQLNVREEYHKMIQAQEDFYKIKCTGDDELLYPPQMIHEKIISLLKINKII